MLVCVSVCVGVYVGVRSCMFVCIWCVFGVYIMCVCVNGGVCELASVLVAPTGCLRTDPSPPPTVPESRLSFQVPPELFKLYPGDGAHRIVATYSSLDGEWQTPPCVGSEAYNEDNGAGGDVLRAMYAIVSELVLLLHSTHYIR